jgi:hypothetical protein
VWWSESDPGKPNQLAKGADVLTVVTPIILAETVSLWADPKEVPNEVTYVNALASDVITKWANWCLTVRMPGEADDAEEQLQDLKGPFQIRCDRNRDAVALLSESQVGEWQLPPLRFGESYEFLLRRVDFAGNHLYDELKPPSDIRAAAVRTIESMVGQTPAARALLDQALLGDSRFVRADLPRMAPLAFPVHRPRPVWQPVPRTGEKEHDCRDLQIAAFEREPLLILFSDVLARVAPLTDDSCCFLLPPAAPVETVLMHGVFDRYEPTRIPYVIRCHERFVAQGILGVDRNGQLNYFGDPEVKKLRLDFVFRQDTVSTNPAADDKPVETRIFEEWPVPCPVKLQIVSGSHVPEEGAPPMARKPLPTTAEKLAQSCQIVHAPDSQTSTIHAVMPPGGYGSARVLPVTVDARSQVEYAHDIGQRVHLLHVTNGALLRPHWLDLREGKEPQSNQTSHLLAGSFEVDAATTGGYILAGYWNECWDEAQSLSWEEATIRYPPDDLTTLTSITVAKCDQGYGYGSDAVVLLTPREKAPAPEVLPILEPVIKNHAIERLDIRSHGKGWTRQLDIRVLRRPPLFRLATAEVRRDRDANGPLQESEIQITDAGGWYTRPPYVVIRDRSGNGYGARATAILNGHGGVDRVQLDRPGAWYSGDIVIRFYTHQWVLPERPIALKDNTVVELNAVGDVWHPFGDAMSRRVDYYLTLLPRHAQYLEAVSPTASANDIPLSARTMVPRDSIALPLDLKATARPSPPNIAFPLLAFHWNYHDGGVGPIDDPRNYFRGLKIGTLTLTRSEAIRVYLRRPWHQSGAQTLGVVVYPAITNTIRVGGDLDSADAGVVNRAEDYPHSPGRTNALTGDVIPGPLRDIVSRWGFDPIWNERALPPLGPPHFLRAISDVAYEVLNPGTGHIASLARLALHAVDYDPVKNLWYSDVVVDMSDLGEPIGAHPFIRLNLVAHQKHGIQGVQSSAIVATDPIPITGQRSLQVTRRHPGRFEFVFSGNFAPDPPKATDFPRRRVVVELQHRDPSLPDDVELLLRPHQRPIKDQHVIKKTTLVRSKDEQTYRGQLTLPPATLASLQANASTTETNANNRPIPLGGHFAIVLKEQEFYRTLSSQPSATGDRTVMMNNVPCAVRTLTSMTFVL